MKKVYLAAIAVAMIIGTSCKKSYTSPGSNSGTDSVTNIVTNGTWIISSYTQKVEDKTNTFAGITFVFSSDGKLTADDKGNKTTGSWSTTPYTPGYYGGPAALATLTISMGTASPFNKIDKSWNVGEKSNSSFKLDNKEPLEDEHLVFSKQ
ncbi:MAG: hypothetical protein JST75_11485 [Bacteroidetes bacterium]|nr:hypothetical protein [Bacteroidota bacterium]